MILDFHSSEKPVASNSHTFYFHMTLRTFNWAIESASEDKSVQGPERQPAFLEKGLTAVSINNSNETEN